MARRRSSTSTQAARRSSPACRGCSRCAWATASASSSTNGTSTSSTPPAPDSHETRPRLPRRPRRVRLGRRRGSARAGPARGRDRRGLPRDAHRAPRARALPRGQPGDWDRRARCRHLPDRLPRAHPGVPRGWQPTRRLSARPGRRAGPRERPRGARPHPLPRPRGRGPRLLQPDGAGHLHARGRRAGAAHRIHADRRGLQQGSFRPGRDRLSRGWVDLGRLQADRAPAHAGHGRRRPDRPVGGVLRPAGVRGAAVDLVGGRRRAVFGGPLGFRVPRCPQDDRGDPLVHALGHDRQHRAAAPEPRHGDAGGRGGRRRAAVLHGQAGDGDGGARLGSGPAGRVPARGAARASAVERARRAVARGRGRLLGSAGPDRGRAGGSGDRGARRGPAARRAPERRAMTALPRWRAGALLAAAGSALLTLALARWAARRYEAAFARRSAATTAAYLALVTPPAPVGADYSLPQLFIQTRSLNALPGWTPRVEVYHGTAPLLEAGAPPLTPGVLDRLRGQAGASWRRGVALAPLFDRDRWDVVGAVAIRPVGIAPGWLGGWTLPALALLAAAALGALRTLGGEWEAVRRALLAYGAAGVLFGAAAYVNVQQAARASTDQWLADARLLMQEASARLPQGRPTLVDLAPLAGGAQVAPGDSATTRPTRQQVGGVPSAVVEGGLSSRRWVELRTAPAEAGALPWLALLLLLALIGPLAAWGAVWAEREAARPQRLRETAAAWGFLAPATLHLAIFSFAPILLAVYVSLHRWSLVEQERPFVGLANFDQLVRDPAVWIALRNTALYTLTVPVTMVLALGAALALGRRTWTARLARTAVFLPYASSVVAVALVWQWMYHADFGAINWVLSLVGVGPVDWLGSPNMALVALMIVSLWVQAGYQMTVFLAGLQAIPRDYLDAARVDGAGAWRRLRTITLPLLKPVTLFVFVTGIISAFQVFTYVYVLTGGGPGHATDVVAYRLYQAAWAFLQFGSASALSLLLFVVLFGATWGQLRLLERRVQYD